MTGFSAPHGSDPVVVPTEGANRELFVVRGTPPEAGRK